MAYGNTPNSIMGESLAHLLHEKSLPTCLHLVKPASANPTEWTTNSSNAYIRSAAAASPLEENVVSPTKFKWQYPFKVCKAPQGLSLNCYFKETVD